jgi:hypothetical protein
MKRGLAGTVSVSATAPFNACQSLSAEWYWQEKRSTETTYHSATLSTTNTTWTGCATKNVLNLSVFIDSVQAFRLRKVCCRWIVTYKIRQQRANNAIKFQIQQLYRILLLTGDHSWSCV